MRVLIPRGSFSARPYTHITTGRTHCLRTPSGRKMAIDGCGGGGDDLPRPRTPPGTRARLRSGVRCADSLPAVFAQDAAATDRTFVSEQPAPWTVCEPREVLVLDHRDAHQAARNDSLRQVRRNANARQDAHQAARNEALLEVTRNAIARPPIHLQEVLREPTGASHRVRKPVFLIAPRSTWQTEESAESYEPLTAAPSGAPGTAAGLAVATTPESHR